MRAIFYHPVNVFQLIVMGMLICNDLQSQYVDSSLTLNFPLPYEDFSLYDFASVRFERSKSAVSPDSLINRKFQPLNRIFLKDSLYFVDSIQSLWLKFTIRNNSSSDTSIALLFPAAVSKAVLYKREGNKSILVGKTGYIITVIARSVYYEDARIDLDLKANTQTNYLLQIVLFNGLWMAKMPVLRSFPYAELRAFYVEREIGRPGLLWSHFFTGIFFMFCVFGFIKYLVLEKDKAYLYYALLGFFNALLSIAQAEYPPLELPWFEDLRGIELFNLINAAAILMQGRFIIEILQLNVKHPRIYRITKWYLFIQLFVAVVYTVDWATTMKYHRDFLSVNTFIQFLLLLFMVSWVIYLSRIRKGFYRFIFLGALTICVAFCLLFIVRFFNLYYLLPGWLGADPRGSVNHFMQMALVIDMCFYFTGLAYRDLQVEKAKSVFQAQLIKQLETNKLLQEKFTGELEQQVQQKTSELIAQSKALEVEKESKLLADFDRRFSESELKALRSQMNPHFIFNILNTIESYALENDKEKASSMIQKFSNLTRLILENSMNPLVHFEEDFKALQFYIQLEEMRYVDSFITKYQIEKEILEGDFYIPPMIIQPFVENAIVHGLCNKISGKGILSIAAILSDGYLRITIEDNGIGREAAARLSLNNPIARKSLGVKVTRDRIAMFNNLIPDRRAKVEIEDLREGTKVTIWFPQKNNNS